METTSRKTTRRYWRRTASSKPWWPWGIAPLAGLAILFLIGALLTAPRIEAEVREQVSERIDAAGLPAFDIRSDGQGVTISTPAHADEELYLQAVAASTQCDTWAGKLDCPTSVEIRRIKGQDAPAVLESRPEPFVDDNVANSVQTSRAVLQGEGNGSSLVVSEQCNADFEKMLSNASIQFQTGSAIIDAGNDALLDQLAELAISCPGNLTVQGHSDNRGHPAANQALSLARAAAVRDALALRGIDSSRLAARGFGDSQPIADNDTPTGRAKNRRIAITIGETQ